MAASSGADCHPTRRRRALRDVRPAAFSSPVQGVGRSGSQASNWPDVAQNRESAPRGLAIIRLTRRKSHKFLRPGHGPRDETDWLGRQDSNLGNGGIKISLIIQRFQRAFGRIGQIRALAISMAWRPFPNENSLVDRPRRTRRLANEDCHRPSNAKPRGSIRQLPLFLDLSADQLC
jgi:hypothetical protein